MVLLNAWFEACFSGPNKPLLAQCCIDSLALRNWGFKLYVPCLAGINDWFNSRKFVGLFAVLIKVLHTWPAFVASRVVDYHLLHCRSLNAQSNAEQAKDNCMESSFTPCTKPETRKSDYLRQQSNTSTGCQERSLACMVNITISPWGTPPNFLIRGLYNLIIQSDCTINGST